MLPPAENEESADNAAVGLEAPNVHAMRSSTSSLQVHLKLAKLLLQLLWIGPRRVQNRAKAVPN